MNRKYKTLLFLLTTGVSMAFGQNALTVDSLLKVSGSFFNSDIEKAIFYAKQAVNVAESDTSVIKRVVAHSTLGRCEAKSGNYDSAIAHFNHNLKKGRETNNDKWISSSLINIANVYLSKGDYEPAIKNHLDALKINEAGKDKSVVRINYLCLGIAYYYFKNYKLSLEYYEKTLALDLALNETARAAYCYNAIGVIYKETGNYKKALDYLSKTENIARNNRDTMILSHNNANLGELYSLLGDTDKAFKYLREAIIMQKAVADEKGAIESEVLLGNLYQRTKKFNEAISTYKIALEAATRMKIKEIKKNCYKGLSETYTVLLNYKVALDYQNLYAQIKDTIFNESTSKQIAEMQTKYESEKKQKENILLVSENKINNLEITRQKNQRNTLIILILFIVLSAAIIFNQIRLKHKNKIFQEKDLRNQAVFKAQEDEKGRLSQELHDGVGPLLSLIKLNVSSIETDQKNKQMVTDIMALASEGIKEVRAISHALMPSLLEKKGLKTALEDYIRQFNQTAGLSVEFSYALNLGLPSGIEINIYRIIQEALTNTLKHARATKAVITLIETAQRIELNIHDNGKGFDMNQVANGNGLNNISSRADVLKGQLAVKSHVDEGTMITIKIPKSYI